jgi:tetratricopeptide (TPR) repeat protein
MGNEQAKDLRQRGIAAAKAGQKAEARQLLQQAIRLEPNNEAAWLWMASVAPTPQDKLFCLQKLLEINPENSTALKAMQALQSNAPAEQSRPAIKAIKPLSGMSSPPAAAPATAPPPRMTTQEMMAQPPGIPVPHPSRLAEAAKNAENTTREYLAPIDTGAITWVQKSRGRAGDRDHLVLRAQMFFGILGFLIVFGGLGTFFVLNNPDARALIFAPTHTPTFTPTQTATSTPGVTATPSPTPGVTATPSATVPPEITPFDIYFPPDATDVYPRPDSVLISAAMALVDAGRAPEALPTLAVERLSVRDLFNPRPYYFEAIAQASAGQAERAIGTMEDAEGQLRPATRADFEPVVDAGFAVVYSILAEQALTSDNGAQGREYANEAERRALDAIEGDSRNGRVYLALARVYRLTDRAGEALSVLDEALAMPEHRADVNLILERARVYLDQGEYDLALYETFFAHYIDPRVEEGHLINIEAALEQNKPGLAVIYAQNFLFYHPGSVAGYKLLGDARLLENKPDLAITAYTQALTAEEPTDITADVYLARAQIYADQRRWDLARNDYTEAFRLNDNPAVQARRMVAAFEAGNYGSALDDAEALTGVIPDSELNFVKARALIESGGDDNQALQEASSLLAGLSGLSEEDDAVANEYFARAQYQLNSLSTALQSINSAMTYRETGFRHYQRGLILEAQGNRNNAADEYEWVLTWSEVYPFPFRSDAQERLNEIRGQ